MTPLRFTRREMMRFAALAPACAPYALQAAAETRSTVSLVKGESRRKNVTEALTAIDDQIKPFIRKKKYVAIKVNNVSTTNQLAASHADAVHGILDYLQPRYKLPVYLVESSAGDSLRGFENFKYTDVAKERKIELIDLNREAKY